MLRDEVEALAERLGCDKRNLWQFALMLQERQEDGVRLFPDEQIRFALVVLIRAGRTFGSVPHVSGTGAGITSELVEALAKRVYPAFIQEKHHLRGFGTRMVMIHNARALHGLLPHGEPKAMVTMYPGVDLDLGGAWFRNWEPPKPRTHVCKAQLARVKGEGFPGCKLCEPYAW
jgi:hypothetical protein